jgi:polyhydroxyalkanoate synthesis regulator protein
MAQAFGPTAFQAMEEQVRTNMGFFREAMRMFSPFAVRGAAGEERSGETGELESLKRQMADMQSKLDSLSRGK